MSRLNRGQRRRRGFALIVALSLLFIVGATLAMMAATFGGEIRRASANQTDTQLRQLLVAGETIAQARLENHATTQPLNVELPPALSREGAKLRLAGNPRQMRIEAELGGHHAAEVVSFTHTSTGWKISNVHLGR